MKITSYSQADLSNLSAGNMSNEELLLSAHIEYLAKCIDNDERVIKELRELVNSDPQHKRRHSRNLEIMEKNLLIKNNELEEQKREYSLLHT
jgi:DNA-binding SARP family transcriptional activator